MRVNDFYRLMHLNLRSRYAWEGTGGRAFVFKLWKKDPVGKSSKPLKFVCLRPVRPTGQRGSRWDDRHAAVLEVASGRAVGFATLGDEGNGKQKSYVGFETAGVHRVLSIEQLKGGTYVANLSSELVDPEEVRAAVRFDLVKETSQPTAPVLIPVQRADKSVCEAWIGDIWQSVPVSFLLQNGQRGLSMRCPLCHGAVRLECASANGRMKDRFEHKRAHAGCSLSIRFNGTSAPHPAPAVPPLRDETPLDNFSMPIDLDAAKKMIGNVPSKTERTQLLAARLGQGRFRRSLINLWKTCSVTGCEDHAILVASHIVPWAQSNNADRLNPFNGLLLTASLDKLFDQHFVTFDEHGQMLTNPRFTERDLKAAGVSADMRLRALPDALKPYLARHREKYHDVLRKSLRPLSKGGGRKKALG